MFDKLRRLCRIDSSQNLQFLSINLFRLVAFSNFHPSCCLAVLKALHKMASPRRKLTATRWGSEDSTFFAEMSFLLGVLRDAWKAGTLHQYARPEFCDGEEANPKHAWSGPAADSTEKESVVSVLIGTVACFDVSLKGGENDTAIQNAAAEFRLRVCSIVKEYSTTSSSSSSEIGMIVSIEEVDATSSEISEERVKPVLASKPTQSPAGVRREQEPVEAQAVSTSSESSDHTASDQIVEPTPTHSPPARSTTRSDRDEISPAPALEAQSQTSKPNPSPSEQLSDEEDEITPVRPAQPLLKPPPLASATSPAFLQSLAHRDCEVYRLRSTASEQSTTEVPPQKEANSGKRYNVNRKIVAMTDFSRPLDFTAAQLCPFYDKVLSSAMQKSSCAKRS